VPDIDFYWHQLGNDRPAIGSIGPISIQGGVDPLKTETIRALARQVADAGRTTNPDGLAEDALAREATSATGLPGGIAIPHCRTEHVDVPTLAFARLSPGTDFGAKDGPADLAFLIAAPAGGDATHLKVLTQLARALVKKEFTDGLRGAASEQEVVDLVNNVVSAPGATPAPAKAPAAAAAGGAAAAATATPAARSGRPARSTARRPCCGRRWRGRRRTRGRRSGCRCPCRWKSPWSCPSPPSAGTSRSWW